MVVRNIQYRTQLTAEMIRADRDVRNIEKANRDGAQGTLRKWENGFSFEYSKDLGYHVSNVLDGTLFPVRGKKIHSSDMGFKIADQIELLRLDGFEDIEVTWEKIYKVFDDTKKISRGYGRG